MTGTDASWVLAFDASCRTCRMVARRVVRACDGKLDVLPLAHRDVRQWREQSLGSDAPWAPTLLEIRDDGVRAWTGAGMAVPLARRLGLRSALRVLASIGESRRPEQRRGQRGAAVPGLARIVQVGAGIAVVTGLMFADRAPAAAWVEANRDRLPTRYDDVIAHPMDVRKAVYAEMSPQQRSQAWVDHLNAYRGGHPDLSAAQNKVVDDAVAVAATQAVFGQTRGPDVTRRLQDVRQAAIEAFGRNEAAALLATLGPAQDVPPDDPEPRVRGCTCSTADDWCTNATHCEDKPEEDWCQENDGCGNLWLEDCVGLCVN